MPQSLQEELACMPDTLDPDERFFLDSDDDGHWYVVPKSKEDEWYKWLGIDRSLVVVEEAPEWVIEVGGAPSLVTFSNPVVE